MDTNSRSVHIAAQKSRGLTTVKTQQGNMVSLISVVKVLLRQKVMLSMLVDILIGAAAINRALDAVERKADA